MERTFSLLNWIGNGFLLWLIIVIPAIILWSISRGHVRQMNKNMIKQIIQDGMQCNDPQSIETVASYLSLETYEVQQLICDMRKEGVNIIDEAGKLAIAKC